MGAWKKKTKNEKHNKKLIDLDIEYIEKTKTLIGTRRKELIDKETGEIIEVDQITKKVYGQKNFWKLYLGDFLPVLGIVESKQVDILIYILENTQPSTNMFVGTYKTIQKNLINI